MPTFARISSIGLVCALALLLVPVADGVHGGRRSRRDPGDLVGGRLIVKYRDSVDSCVHCLLARRELFAGAVADGGERFEELHRAHGVRSARPVFRLADEEARLFPDQTIVPMLDLRRYHRQRLETARRAFTSRSRRARRGVDPPDLHHVYLLKLGPRSDPMAAAAGFSKNPHVEYAHPDYLVRAAAVPNDPLYHSTGSWGQPYDDLWGLKADKLDLAPAWDVSQGEGTVVAVVDTGIDYRHEDIKANVWSNSREVRGNGVDDDRNGFVDDVQGWDFTTCMRFGTQRCRSEKEPDNDPIDDHFHGTHIAGTIAAVGNNGKGIIGVAPKARVMAVKGLNKDGHGGTADLAAAIVYAASNGADVINNSWGCGFCPEVPLHVDALEIAYAMGTVVVFAAGNTARDNRASSPLNTHRPKPIVVAASAPDDQPTFFTSFGAAVDVAAPGGVRSGSERPNILSLRLKGKCRVCRRNALGKEYMRLQGTSMAAPHVAGLAALILSNRPGLGPDEVRQILRASSDDIAGIGFDLRSGMGRINARRALALDSPLSAEITSPKHLTAPRKSRVTVRGTAAGPGFESYQLFASREHDIEWVPITGAIRSPKRNGTLGALTRSDLESGWNLLRLVVTSSNGRSYDDVVSVGVQSRPKRIAADLEGFAFAPDISGDWVVWNQLIQPIHNLRGHIYLYNVKTKRSKRLTEKPVFGTEPKISGNRVVWHSEIDNRTSPIFSCVIEGPSGECPARTIVDHGSYPVVDGDRVTYWVNHGLSAIDLDRRSERRLGSSWLIYDMDGDLVAWQDTRLEDGMDVVRVFDWSTEQATTVAEHKRIVGLAVSDRSLVFSTLDDGGKATLRHHDLDSGVESELLDGFPLTRGIDYAGGRVVWSEVSEIAVYEPSRGRRSAAALYPLTLRATPAATPRTLVWIDVQHSEEDAGALYFSRVRN